MSFAFGLKARRPDETHRVSTELELFFDLVIVTAVAAQTATIHHAIIEGGLVQGLLGFLTGFIMIWWTWTNYTWFASAFDNDDWLCRILTLVMMIGIAIIAGSIKHIYTSQSLGFAMVGWVIVRIALIGLWLRVLVGDSTYRRSAWITVAGLTLTQIAWMLHFVFLDVSEVGYSLIGIILLAELLVPIIAGLVKNPAFHLDHINERYGLLTIIVLGELVLSVTLFFAAEFGEPFNAEIFVDGTSGLLIAGALWWLYFIEEKRLIHAAHLKTALFTYLHLPLYFAIAMIGAGLAAELNILQVPLAPAEGTYAIDQPMHGIRPQLPAQIINWAISVFLLSLLLIRDVFLVKWHYRAVLLGGAAMFVIFGSLAVPIWGSATGLILVLLGRIIFQHLESQDSHR